MSERTVVADAILAALRLEDVSQATLAFRTGLTTKHISQVLTGKCALSADVAIRIQRALTTVSAEELMVAQARAVVRAALKG